MIIITGVGGAGEAREEEPGTAVGETVITFFSILIAQMNYCVSDHSQLQQHLRGASIDFLL